MNIVIDIGTSYYKIAIYRQSEMIYKESLHEIPINYFINLFSRYPEISHAILSSVRKRDTVLIDFLRNQCEYFIELSSSTPVPVENLYSSPETLGYDRLAAAVGANSYYPSVNILIIDIGTAITIDFINEKNQYLGGNISPGMEMRFLSLHNYTAHLPLLKDSEKFEFPGNNTSSAITGGVQYGILFELEGYINMFKKRYSNSKIIATGGNANFFVKMLKNSIFVDLNLTLKGLNRILEYNAAN